MRLWTRFSSYGTLKIHDYQQMCDGHFAFGLSENRQMENKTTNFMISRIQTAHGQVVTQREVKILKTSESLAKKTH